MNINENYPGFPRSVSRTFAYHLAGCSGESLQVNGLGLKEEMKPCWNRRPRGNRDYLILYFYDSVEFVVGSGNAQDARGKWIILTPGMPHSYGSDNSHWNHSWLHFSADFIKVLLKKRGIPVNSLVNIGNPSDFENMLISIHNEIYYFNPPMMEIIKDQLNSGLLRISRDLRNRDREVIIPETYMKIKQLFDFSYNDEFNLTDLSGIAGCTVPHFCNKFKSLFNYSPIDYLVNRRIDIAKNFLDSTDMSIGEISHKVGYDDVYYFSRLFKKRTGLSPSIYRRNFRGNL